MVGFDVRPELHQLIWEFSIACNSKDLPAVTSHLKIFDSWRLDGTATRIEAGVIIGTLKVSLDHNCASHLKPELTRALADWTAFYRQQAPKASTDLE